MPNAEAERLRARIDAALSEVKRLRNERDKALAEIDAALALHESGPAGFCTECADPCWDECDTVKALKGGEK
jgi:hypothetical protein